MATTIYFDGTLKDKGEKSEIALEFGRSNFYGENTMYFTINGTHVVLTESGGREVFEAMVQLGASLGYHK
jgi:hypothetical protein